MYSGRIRLLIIADWKITCSVLNNQ